MAQRIVDLLEFIEINQEQCDLARRRPCFGKFCTQMLIQRIAISEARQRVAQGKMPDSLRLALPDRNIPQHNAVLGPIDSLPLRETGLKRKFLVILAQPLELHDLAAGRLEFIERQIKNRERDIFSGVVD